LRFPLDFRHCFKTSSLQFHFRFGNKAKSQEVGKSGDEGGWATTTMLLLVTNSLVFRDLWVARCRDEGASCGCTKVPVFFC
jgi:hypothetical protein